MDNTNMLTLSSMESESDTSFDHNLLTDMKESNYFDIDSLNNSIGETKNKSGLFSLNIQCLAAKWDLFIATINILQEHGTSFDIINLQETWLTDDPGIFEIPGYVSFNLPCCSSTHGGVENIRQRCL